MRRRLMIGMAMTASILALAPLGAAAAASPGPGGLASPELRMARQTSMHVFDMNERALVKPRRFVISGTASMTELQWRKWGAARPVASGVLEIQTCEPNCAEGTIDYFRIQLQLRGSDEANGMTYYAQYRAVFSYYAKGRVVDDSKVPGNIRREYGKWTPAFPPSGSE